MVQVNMKTVTCKEHGGTFEIPRKRGRPPGQCTAENPCTMVKLRKGPRTEATKAVAARTAQTLKGKVPTRSGGRQPAKVANARTARQTARTEPAKAPPKRAPKSTPEASEVVVRHNPSIPFAQKAREQLEPLGWALKGRGWVDEDEAAWAEVVATRGPETLAIRWRDGKFYSQDYSLWDSDKTAGQQNMPKATLPFDPDEMSDEELAKELAGRKITWWNRIASSTESAIIGDKFQIQHNYTGGNETSRQVLFVDQTPGYYKFRAFNVDAMMRVK